MEDKREIPAIVNEKISDLVPDFMNFNALKIISKIHKKIIKKDPGLMLIQWNLPVAVYICKIKEKSLQSAMVNEKIVI